MKKYLIDTFQYNNITNCKLIEKLKELPEPSEAIKLFSHLVNSQYKWMARIVQDPEAAKMSWWDPVYPIEELEVQWLKSLQTWLDYLESISEEMLATEVMFTGFDGAKWVATPADIMLQLNYHSIHHRAQIQTILRVQGIVPDFVDYIGSKYRKVD